MGYASPGRADQLSDELVSRWNDQINSAYQALEPSLGSRFFSLDPAAVSGSITVQVGWFGDPAEPRFCLDPQSAQQLSDWGIRGRHQLHNEYCEYAVVTATDTQGTVRPKRVQITTELPEYWLIVATWAPSTVRDMAEQVLGVQPAWHELYGPGVTDPDQLSPQQRKVGFATQVAGNVGDRQLQDANVPELPIGALNTANALFMTHPINGLDDLLYIVLFGAQPYARRTPAGVEPASREEIFRDRGVEHLACRHADPAAAMAAAGAAFEGRTVAFADPLGMYLKSFTSEVFTVDGLPIPAEWVRFSRGEPDRFQRLDFGPGDDDPRFLDDITIVLGASETPLTGGYQVVQQLEVGPFVLLGSESPVAEDEYVVVQGGQQPIRCNEAAVCRSIVALKAAYDQAHESTRVAPRTTVRDR